MIVSLGHFTLFLALIASLFQSTVPLIGASWNKKKWMKWARKSAAILVALLSISLGALTYAYVTSDFSVMNVAENSHSMKPLLYKVAAVWGNHEGSMLLWIWMLCFWGVLVAKFGKKLPLPFQARVLSIQGMITVGFTLFILLTSNPFIRLDPPAMEGLDLNPILQDPLLAIHPPLLYIGYVGFSIAFCFAMAALIEKKIDGTWASFLRPWVLAAWSALTAGIAMGSFWAYYELGWGGFWFWDPVENASLMPWIAGTALFHSIVVLEKRNALKSWTIFLAILAFSLSLLGTFLVRSGILTSVHAFAVDPARGVFILLLLTLAIGGALFMYALRTPDIKAGESFSAASRETTLLLNNVFLFTFCATVVIGTFYPVFLSALDMGSVSVGAPYYNKVLLPMLVPFALLMGMSPVLAWKEARAPIVVKKLVVPFALTVLLAVIILLIPAPGKPITVVVFFCAGWVLLTSAYDLYKKTDHFKDWRTMPLSFYGMLLAHAGFALLLMGTTATSQWGSEKIVWLKQGESIEIAGNIITFKDATEDAGSNHNIDRVHLTVETKNIFALPCAMSPEKRWYPVQQKATSETSLCVMGFDMLYSVLGDQDMKNHQRWVVRLYYHPLLLWIYLGAAMIATGGVLAGWKRKRK